MWENRGKILVIVIVGWLIAVWFSRKIPKRWQWFAFMIFINVILLWAVVINLFI